MRADWSNATGASGSIAAFGKKGSVAILSADNVLKPAATSSGARFSRVRIVLNLASSAHHWISSRVYPQLSGISVAPASRIPYDAHTASIELGSSDATA